MSPPPKSRSRDSGAIAQVRPPGQFFSSTLGRQPQSAQKSRSLVRHSHTSTRSRLGIFQRRGAEGSEEERPNIDRRRERPRSDDVTTVMMTTSRKLDARRHTATVRRHTASEELPSPSRRRCDAKARCCPAASTRGNRAASGETRKMEGENDAKHKMRVVCVCRRLLTRRSGEKARAAYRAAGEASFRARARTAAVAAAASAKPVVELRSAALAVPRSLAAASHSQS